MMVAGPSWQEPRGDLLLLAWPGILPSDVGETQKAACQSMDDGMMDPRMQPIP